MLLQPFLRIPNKMNYELEYADYNTAYSYLKIFNPTTNNTLAFKSNSIYTYKKVPANLLINSLKQAPKNGGFNGIFFSPFGGAIKSNQGNNSSFAYRSANYFLTWYSEWDAKQEGEDNIAWCVNSRKQILPYGCGSYYNYVDSTLTNYKQDYFGENVRRLQEIKKKYNPSKLFDFPQKI